MIGISPGQTIAIELNGVPYAPIHDPYGNVALLLDVQGEVAAHYRYSAFGDSISYGQSSNPWLYVGKRLDQENGLVLFRSTLL